MEVNIGQKVNIGRISKIVNFHPIHLKFKELLHVWSLNSTANYFLGQICFMFLFKFLQIWIRNEAALGFFQIASAQEQQQQEQQDE